MKHSLFLPAAILPLLLSLPNAAASRSFRNTRPCVPEWCPENTPPPAPSRHGENRTYRVGPKGGVYYINSHNKKVYIKSRRIQ